MAVTRGRALNAPGLLRICSTGGLLLLLSGCTGTLYGWTVRTTSSPMSQTADSVSLGHEPIAVFTDLAPSNLRGNEIRLADYLGATIRKVAPQWKIVDTQHMISLINEQGLAGEYVRMRADAEQSHVLDRDLLRKLGAAIGARFVFQPRLAYSIKDFKTGFRCLSWV